MRGLTKGFAFLIIHGDGRIRFEEVYENYYRDKV